MTASGQADLLKSFTIAVDGLDKNPDDSPDAYARVQIARLRNTLDAYYTKMGVPDEGRLQLAPGAYKVLIHHKDAPASETEPTVADRRRIYLKIFVCAIVLFAIMTTAYQIYQRRETQAAHVQWRTSNFPVLSVKVMSTSAGFGETPILEQDILTKLAPYEGFKLTEGSVTPPDFAMMVNLTRSTDGFEANVKITETSSARVIWARSFSAAGRSSQSLSDMSAMIAFQTGNTTGAIHSYNWRKLPEPDTPYACWLRFAGLVEVTKTIRDDPLYECAEAWYRNASLHPLAAMLRGWTLSDRALVQLSQARHDALLREALTVLYEASATSPDSVGLHLAMMRAQSFAGNAEAIKLAGHNALRLNPDSPHVQALVGTTFALWNDPEGIVLLKRAIAMNPSSPAWYRIGMAVDAMMRDDTVEEGRYVASLSTMYENRPLLLLLSAAHSARIGRLSEARGLLLRPPFQTMMGGMRLDPIINRLPAAPAVRKKLRELLRPVLEKEG
ncbi:MAG TPA: hypothetical protein VGE05_08100 [Novosphingobium sp.]